MVKNLPASAGDATDLSLIPRLGSSPGEGNGNPLQGSCLGNCINGGVWWATVHGIAKSQTRLSARISSSSNLLAKIRRAPYW